MRDTKDVEELKHIVRGCLRKHVITPYKQLPNTHVSTYITLARKCARLNTKYFMKCKVCACTWARHHRVGQGKAGEIC